MFRTEQYARELPEGSSLPLMATSLATIAAMSFTLTAATHVPETQALLGNPLSALPVIAALGWKQIATILYTGILSTDGVLLIEVSVHQFACIHALPLSILASLSVRCPHRYMPRHMYRHRSAQVPLSLCRWQ